MTTKLQQLYRDELSFLRLQGKAFAKRHPQLSRFLAEESADPDVERLLEGFAFLTARLREKIEDDFPELTGSLINLLWPNYLRPIPSMTIMRFDPSPESITHHQVVPKGTLVRSGGGESEDCRFHTVADLDVYPLVINDVGESRSRDKSIVTVTLTTLTEQPMATIGCAQLGFYLSGDAYTALTIYMWVFRYLDQLVIKNGDKTTRLSVTDIDKCSFSSREALLPYPKNVFDGYRIIQEYLAFPQRFYYFKLTNLDRCWSDGGASEVTMEFHFNRPMTSDIKIRRHDFSLYCVPAINLFKHSSEPVLMTGERVSYPLIPSNKEKGDLEIFSVEEVTSAIKDSTGKKIEQTRRYPPFESFQHEVERHHGRKELYYRLSVKPAVDNDGLDHYLSFVRSDEQHHVGCYEIVSAELYCTNGARPQMLGIGDITERSQETPSFINFTNITKPTPSYPPVLDGSLHWTLLSNMALNYLSILNKEPLKNILRTYDFAAQYDIQAQRRSQQRLDGIKDITSKPVDMLLKGLPARGLESVMTVDQTAFLCEGEVYLFGTVLSKFFSLYSSINSFHLLKIHNLSNNENYLWKMEPGKQPLI